MVNYEEKDVRTGKAPKHQIAALESGVSKWTKKEKKDSIVWTNKEMKEVTVEIHHSIFETTDDWGKHIELDYYHVFLAMGGFPISDYSEEYTGFTLSQIETIARRYRKKYDKEGDKLLFEQR